MNKNFLKKLNIPNNPGVYFFKKGEKILYVGKATSLRSRIKSYFNKNVITSRGEMILEMIFKADNLKWEKTDSVLEAIILEASLIKKYQPKYNTKEKDNKSWNYVCITKDEIPRVTIQRARNLNKKKYSSIFGPFVNGTLLREAMKIIRPIFPYFDDDSLRKNNKEFYKQIGLVPVDSYKNNIKNFKLFFQSKKKNILVNLKKEMMIFAKKKEFEKANEVKKRIFALNHINDVFLIKNEILSNLGKNDFRIEAYDVAHMFGKNMVGVMTVIENGEVNKKEYRKFIIKTQNKANDTGALEEIFYRRFRHTEWRLPNIIVVDGGIQQWNKARSIQKKNIFSESNITIVSVLKDNKHKPKAILGDEKIIKKYKKEILLANNESHRFAITFHKKKRDKNFLNMV